MSGQLPTEAEASRPTTHSIDLAGGRYPGKAEDPTPVAWRCEHCRKLFGANIASEIIYVDEVQSAWSESGGVKRHARFIRRMVVCPPCRRTIADTPGRPDSR